MGLFNSDEYYLEIEKMEQLASEWTKLMECYQVDDVILIKYFDDYKLLVIIGSYNWYTFKCQDDNGNLYSVPVSLIIAEDNPIYHYAQQSV